MKKLIMILVVLIISSFSVLSIQSNLPSCWVMSSTGVSIDSNCDGIIEVSNLNLSAYNTSTQIATALNLKLDKTDQRYNDTSLIVTVNSSLSNYYLNSNPRQYINISSVNTTSYYLASNPNQFINISSVNTTLYYLASNPLNFMNESYADTKYYLASNPQGYVNDSGLQLFNETSKINAVNTTSNMNNLGFNVSSQLKTWFDSLYYSVSNPRQFINISSVNTTLYYLASNPSGYNNNVTLYYPLSNPNGYISSTNVTSYYLASNPNQFINISSVNTTFYMLLTDQRYNESSRVSALESSNSSMNTRMNAMESSNTSQGTLITNLQTDNTTQASLINLKANILNPTFTGNITVNEKVIHAKSGNVYWMSYVNATVFMCVNSTGSMILNNGNSSITCV